MYFSKWNMSCVLPITSLTLEGIGVSLYSLYKASQSNTLYCGLSVCSGNCDFFKIIYFNWRLITLQHCVGFCHTLTWINHGCTCFSPVPPTFLPIPSLWVVPVHWLWVPCYMHWTWLVICLTYGNIHVSVLFSQIFLPVPSPTESKSLFFTPVSLLSCRSSLPSF